MITDRIEEYFGNLGCYTCMSPSNKELAQDKLSGYLDAYIALGYLTEGETKAIFNRLTYEEPFILRTDL
jgi:hypothetical protein